MPSRPPRGRSGPTTERTPQSSFPVAEQAEAEYRRKAAEFRQVMLRAVGIFNAIDAGRQSRAIRMSTIHDFDGYAPMIRLPDKVMDALDADTAAYVSKLSDWRVSCIKAMAVAEQEVCEGAAFRTDERRERTI